MESEPDPVSATIRVLVVDHPVIRRGLKLLIGIEEDMEVVGEAGNVEDAVSETAALEPDVIVFDVVLPGRSGIEGLTDLQRACARAKVVVLSMEDSPTYVRDALAAGAGGYVLKDAVDTEILRAIREVAAGRRYLQPELGARLAVVEPPASAGPPAEGLLSRREHEVLPLLALGHSNQEIAARLEISVRTVEGHRASIMQKLGLANRAEIIRYAIVHGLFEQDPLS